MRKKEIADLVKEAKLLGMFNPPNIVKLRDYLITLDHLDHICASCKSYAATRIWACEVKVIKKNKKLLPEDAILTWFLQDCPLGPSYFFISLVPGPRVRRG